MAPEAGIGGPVSRRAGRTRGVRRRGAGAGDSPKAPIRATLSPLDPQRPALIVAAHGSKSAGWADAIHALVRDVRETAGVADVFSTVSAGFLEESEPELADAVAAALEAGASEAIVVPLFLTASMHQREDVPAILGQPVPTHIRRRVIAEGHRVLPPGLPIRLAPLGEVAAILHRNAVRRTSLESRDPAREAIVLVAYGSTIYHEEWEQLLHDVRLRLLHDGWCGVAHAYCGHVVQLSPEPTYKAILHAAQQAGVRRVHVVPLLMAVSELQAGPNGPIRVACQAALPKLAKDHVQLRYAGDAILPDGDIAARIAFVALQAVGVVAPVLRSFGTSRGEGLA